MFGDVDQAKMELSFIKMAERRFKAVGRPGLSSFVDLSVPSLVLAQGVRHFALIGWTCYAAGDTSTPVWTIFGKTVAPG